MLIRIEQMTQIKVLISSSNILSKVKSLNFVCVIKMNHLWLSFFSFTTLGIYRLTFIFLVTGGTPSHNLL